MVRLPKAREGVTHPSGEDLQPVPGGGARSGGDQPPQ